MQGCRLGLWPLACRSGELDAVGMGLRLLGQWRLRHALACGLLRPVAAWRDRNVVALAELGESGPGDAEFNTQLLDRLGPDASIQVRACEEFWHGRIVRPPLPLRPPCGTGH